MGQKGRESVTSELVSKFPGSYDGWKGIKVYRDGCVHAHMCRSVCVCVRACVFLLMYMCMEGTSPCKRRGGKEASEAGDRECT